MKNYKTPLKFTTMVKIQITSDDIKKGEVCSSDKCPVALALKRKLRYAAVFSGGIKLWPNTYKRIPYPKGVWEKIQRFDHSRQMRPFTMTIEVPSHFLKD